MLKNKAFKVKIHRDALSAYKEGNIGKLFLPKRHSELMIDLADGSVWTDFYDGYEDKEEIVYHSDSIKNLGNFIRKNKEKVNATTIRKYALILKEGGSSEQLHSQ